MYLKIVIPFISLLLAASNSTAQRIPRQINFCSDGRFSILKYQTTIAEKKQTLIRFAEQDSAKYGLDGMAEDQLWILDGVPMDGISSTARVISNRPALLRRTPLTDIRYLESEDIPKIGCQVRYTGILLLCTDNKNRRPSQTSSTF